MAPRDAADADRTLAPALAQGAVGRQAPAGAQDRSVGRFATSENLASAGSDSASPDDATAVPGAGRPASARAGDLDLLVASGSAAAARAFQLEPGARFGPCVLVSPLGRGGMGEVWLARNEVLSRDEAVKVLLASNPDARARARFVREARAALDLGEAREVVRCFDVAEEGGRLFIRMEYVAGVSLDKRIGAVAPLDVLPLFKGMAAALAVGHRRGLVHRDIKPSNFLYADDGTVKLMDFGLARPAGEASLTLSQEAMGTPAYMSLEQWDSAKSVDARADVYSLGVSFYYLLAGRSPFELARGAPMQAYYAKLLAEDPRPLDLPQGLPAQLQNLILKAMAKRAPERFRDADEVLGALARLEEDPTAVIAKPASEAERGRRRRAARTVGALALLVAAAIAAVLGYTAYVRRTSITVVERALEDASRALRQADEASARGDLGVAVEALDAGLAHLQSAREEAARARDRGAGGAEVEAVERGIARRAMVADGAHRALVALAAAKPGEAHALFLELADHTGDGSTFQAARERARRAAGALALLRDAEAAAHDHPVEALRLAALAERDALDGEAAQAIAAFIERVRGEALAEVTRRAATTRELVARGPAGLAEAKRALEGLDRYPGGSAARADLAKHIADEERRLAAGGRAAEALAAARAAEAEGRAGRPAATKGYLEVVAALDALADVPEMRAALEAALGLTATEGRAALARLAFAERIDTAATAARTRGGAIAGHEALARLAAEAAGSPELAPLGPVLAGALEEARELGFAEARGAVEAALAASEPDWASARAHAAHAVRLAPADDTARTRARDIARYVLARASQVPAPSIDQERILVPPVTVTVAGADIYVPPFAIDRYEVTNRRYRDELVAPRGGGPGGYARPFPGVPEAAFRGFLREGGRVPGPATWAEEPAFPPSAAERPVGGVSWHEARAFAAAAGGRLPTPLEWTVAAGYDPARRALRRYPWGDHDQPTGVRLDGRQAVSVNGTDLRGDESPLAVIGLAGNLWEWVDAGSPAVCGGSAWSRGVVEHARVLAKPRPLPAERRTDAEGFRCVYDLPEPAETADAPR